MSDLPQPVVPALDGVLKQQEAAIPAGKRGLLTTTITTKGVEAGIGSRLGKNTTVTGWAGREWGGKGWTAGARVGVSW